MDSFKHVLAAIDFSTAATAALALGSRIAGATGARLTLLHVYPCRLRESEAGPHLPQASAVDEATKTAVLSDVSHMAGAAGSIVRNVQVAMREGDPSEEILAYARAHGVDLIVMGTHGRRGLDWIIGGSVAERVTRDAEVSVLAVRDPRPGERVSPPRVSKIVCAVDLGESSGDTLDVAAMLARVTGGRLTVLHAIELWQWEDPWPIARGDEDECVRRLSQEGHRRLADFLARHRQAGVALEPIVVVGHPRQDVLNAAEQEHADLLIVGAHRLSRMGRMLSGSTAQHVLRTAHCPVLIARPGSRSSTVAVGSSDRAAAPVR